MQGRSRGSRPPAEKLPSWTFAVTENIRNYNNNNTPDIGFQIGWAYSPAFMR